MEPGLLAEAVKELTSGWSSRRQMRAIFSLSCPHWRSLSSTARTSVFHTHSACLGNVHIVLPKSNLLARVEKGDWLWGSLALCVVFLLLRFKDLEGSEQDANILNWIFYFVTVLTAGLACTLNVKLEPCLKINLNSVISFSIKLFIFMFSLPLPCSLQGASPIDALKKQLWIVEGWDRVNVSETKEKKF